MDSTSIILLVQLFVISYLIGSLNTAKILTNIFGIGGKGDISKIGTGNAGANNTFRQLGVKWGIAVLILDMGRGVGVIALAQWLASWVGLEFKEEVWFACALFAMIGHNWPIYFNFQGGKGIAITGGSLLYLHPFSAVVTLLPVLILPFFKRLSGLAPFVAIPVYAGANLLFGDWVNADMNVWLIGTFVAILAITFLRRIHAEWAEIKKAPSKIAALWYLFIYDRATNDPPLLLPPKQPR